MNELGMKDVRSAFYMPPWGTQSCLERAHLIYRPLDCTPLKINWLSSFPPVNWDLAILDTVLHGGSGLPPAAASVIGSGSPPGIGAWRCQTAGHPLGIRLDHHRRTPKNDLVVGTHGEKCTRSIKQYSPLPPDSLLTGRPEVVLGAHSYSST